MRLQSESTRAVLPEPTGPATPTRKGSFEGVMRARWVRGSGAKQAGVLVLVPGREQGLAEARRGQVEIGQVEGALDPLGGHVERAREDALRVGLPEGDQAGRRA